MNRRVYEKENASQIIIWKRFLFYNVTLVEACHEKIPKCDDFMVMKMDEATERERERERDAHDMFMKKT